MIFNKPPTEAYVWVWLPGEIKPVVAGRLFAHGPTLLFNYGSSYLKRGNAIPLYDSELPLKQGIIEPLKGLGMAGCLRDAAPDAWGRWLILNTRYGLKGKNVDTAQIDELTYLLESGSDRIGALDFQKSPTAYEPRTHQGATLEHLREAAESVERGIPLPTALAQALQHGSSIGGARPKTLLDDSNKKYVAKFSLQSDIQNIVKAEFIAMRLAYHAGINVASVKLASAMRKDVLLVERFDRTCKPEGWARKTLVSALTIQELDEMMARYASYETLAEYIRRKFTSPKETLRELFARISFNILCGNTDDHARNHAAFWDGTALTLTPAYDICPQTRVGREATQAMLIHKQDRRSRLATCLEASSNFHLSRTEARNIIDSQIEAIQKNWQTICDEAELSGPERNIMWQTQFLNPYAFDEY
jgi:serine/threonine-protein kinase HipA